METAEELRTKLREAEEREGIEKRVKEYIRIRDTVAGAGDLDHDEVITIANALCINRGVYENRSGW